MILDINIAESLRKIASESEKTVGKALLACQKAANKGESFAIVKVPADVYWFVSNNRTNDAPPFVEKMKSLGFKLEAVSSMREAYDWLGRLGKIKVYW